MACWYVLATGTFGEGTMDGTTVTCFVAVGALNHCSPGYHAISAITCTLHARSAGSRHGQRAPCATRCVCVCVRVRVDVCRASVSPMHRV